MPATTVEISLPMAAKHMGIPWVAAWNLVQTGGIEARQVNGRWRVDVASIERLVAQRELETNAA